MPGWWVLTYMQIGGLQLVVAWAIWVILSITLHELAHGWAAIRKGDMTPIHTGHMTWNPLVHMGPTSLIVFAITGIAWGMMPIDPTRLRGRYAEAFVAFAGPLMNLALSALCIIGGGIALAFLDDKQLSGSSLLRVAPDAPVAAKLAMFFGIGSMLNIGLFLFNMLPCPPLDGSRVLSNFSRAYRNLLETQVGQFLAMIVFALAFFLAGPAIGVIGGGVTRWGMVGLCVILKLAGVGP